MPGDAQESSGFWTTRGHASLLNLESRGAWKPASALSVMSSKTVATDGDGVHPVVVTRPEEKDRRVGVFCILNISRDLMQCM